MKLNPEITKFRLGVCCPTADDGTSLVRGVGPLAAMAREDRRLELVFADVQSDGSQYLGWDWLVSLDALIMQRPFRALDIHAAVTAKSFGIPLWMDWDDDLTCVSELSPYSRLYPQQQMPGILTRLASLADVITVTTGALRERIAELANETEKIFAAQITPEKVRVVPNACPWKFTAHKRERLITWRGGKSHDEDLMEFLPAISEVARMPQLCNFKWLFLGEPHPLVKRMMPAQNLLQTWGDHIHQYIAGFGHLGPWVNMVPLADCAFNKSKSNLAWIEGTCAGAITLAPDWPEWQRPGIVRYKGKDDFKKGLIALMQSFGALTFDDVSKSRKFIEENLLLGKVNEQRWDIVNSFATEAQRHRGAGARATAPAAQSNL